MPQKIEDPKHLSRFRVQALGSIFRGEAYRVGGNASAS